MKSWQPSGGVTSHRSGCPRQAAAAALRIINNRAISQTSSAAFTIPPPTLDSAGFAKQISTICSPFL